MFEVHVPNKWIIIGTNGNVDMELGPNDQIISLNTTLILATFFGKNWYYTHSSYLYVKLSLIFAL